MTNNRKLSSGIFGRKQEAEGDGGSFPVPSVADMELVGRSAFSLSPGTPETLEGSARNDQIALSAAEAANYDVSSPAYKAILDRAAGSMLAASEAEGGYVSLGAWKIAWNMGDRVLAGTPTYERITELAVRAAEDLQIPVMHWPSALAIRS